MSEHNQHETAIKTPGQLVAAVIGFFAVTIFGIILLVIYVTTNKLTGAGTESQSPEAIASRIRPVADAGYTLKDVNAPKVLLAGEAVFTANCAACHATGAAGAPKVGEASQWGPRVAQGAATLFKHAMEGFKAMPARGGNPELDDVEIQRAVVYMANKSGGSLKEPEVPAPAAAAASASASAASAPAADAKK